MTEMCKKHSWAYRDKCHTCLEDADTEANGLTEKKTELRKWYYETNTKDWDDELHSRYGSEVEQEFDTWWKGYKYQNTEAARFKNIEQQLPILLGVCHRLNILDAVEYVKSITSLMQSMKETNSALGKKLLD